MSRYSPLILEIPSYWGPETLPPELPVSRSERDRILYRTPQYESQWASAITIAVTKIASSGWEVESRSPRLSKHAQDLLMYADGGSWTHFLAKLLRDYLCTSVGAVFEVVREVEGDPSSRVVSLHHLPALRCVLTGDPETPIVYTDLQGTRHLLARHEVIRISDLPDDPDGLYSLCAAERAYPTIARLSAIERYVYEKVSGSRPLSIYLVNGLRTDQLTSLIRSAQEQQREQGLVSYMGVIIGGTLKPDSPPSVVEIPLSSLPDGFDLQAERERADLIYANAIGLDPQDLRPISNQQLGAGAQSQVLHEKAKGRGLAFFRQALTHALNTLVLDRRVRFSFVERDLGDQLKRAELSARRISSVVNLVSSGLLSQEEGRQLLYDWEELPEEFVRLDQTSRTVLSDLDQPLPVTLLEEGDSPVLERLLQEFRQILSDLYQSLIVDSFDPDQWYSKMIEAIRDMYTRAFLGGSGKSDLSSDTDRDRIESRVLGQLTFLDRFLSDIRSGRYQTAPALGRSRASMYAESAKALWWEGKTSHLPVPLPAMPGDGTTQCITRCKCQWEIVPLGEENYDCYWRLGPNEDHCQTCLARSRRWSPLRIRDGTLMIE